MKRLHSACGLRRPGHWLSTASILPGKAITIARVTLLCSLLSGCSQIDSLLNKDSHPSSEVARAVKAQLVSNQSVDAAPLRVSVKSATIVLEGFVDDIDQSNKAEEIARSMYPEFNVLNQIIVR